MRIVLFEPQIPQNTGNIVRTCAVTGFSLTLIKPLGFSLEDRWLKRAGLDYWEGVSVETVDDLEDYIVTLKENIWFFTSKGTKLYTEVKYGPNDCLIFGSETIGLPQHIHEKWSNQCIKIPMLQGSRCLNLATSVGIGAYEMLRQIGNLSL